jgi:hypothetical protein
MILEALEPESSVSALAADARFTETTATKVENDFPIVE